MSEAEEPGGDDISYENKADKTPKTRIRKPASKHTLLYHQVARYSSQTNQPMAAPAQMKHSRDHSVTTTGRPRDTTLRDETLG